MNSFWKIALLILVNIAVSVSATLAVLFYWENIRNANTPIEIVTREESPASTIPQNTEDQKTIIPTTPTDIPPLSTNAPTITSVPHTQEPIVPAIRGALVDIALVNTPGTLDTEALRIINTGDSVISLDKWTLEDADGNKLTFPDIQLLRKGVFIEVYTRPGHNTPYEIYWNLSEAAWQSGETAVIKDQLGQIQATYRIP